MITFKRDRFFGVIFLMAFFVNISFSQFRSDVDYEKRFDNSKDYWSLTFTSSYLWACSDKGVIRMDNEEMEYYCLDTNSKGLLSDYLSSAESTQKINPYFEILPTNTEDVWISYYHTNLLLKISKGEIFRYQMDGHGERLISFVTNNETTYFLSEEKSIGDSTRNRIYLDDGDGLKTISEFKTRFPLTWNSLFLYNKELYYSETENGEFGGIYFYSIYKINPKGKTLFFKTPDNDLTYSMSKVKIFGKNIFFIDGKGFFCTIDENANLQKTQIETGHPHSFDDKGIITDETLIYKYHNNIRILSLRSLQKKDFNITERDSSQCPTILYDFFLSRDNFLYSILVPDYDRGGIGNNCPRCIVKISKLD